MKSFILLFAFMLLIGCNNTENKKVVDTKTEDTKAAEKPKKTKTNSF